MPVNNPFLQPIRSTTDYANEYARTDALRNQNALQAMTLEQATQSNAAKGGIRNMLSTLGPDATLDRQIGGLRSLGTPEALAQADTLDTANQNRIKTAATASKEQADADAQRADIKWKLADRHAQQLAFVQTPEDAVAYIDEGIREGSLPMAGRDRAIAMIQQGGVNAWKQMAQQAALPVLEKFKQEAEMARTRLSTDTQVQTTKMNNDTSRANTAATQAGENSRAAQSRATQLRLGGYDANGNLLDIGGQGNPLSGLVDSIGTYKSPESVALARIPPALKSQVLAAVMQKYPDYDPSTFAAKQKAARDFATGTQGNAMRSFAVAGQHLDQLAPLIEALDNGNNQTVNKVGNAIATWNGGTPVTNFDAAKEVVGKEVIKAIVGSGGGVEERQELARQLDAAKSPQQLHGVVKQYRALMSAQHDALHAQRLGAGLPESTMPNYGDAGATATAAGSGWKILGVH